FFTSRFLSSSFSFCLFFCFVIRVSFFFLFFFNATATTEIYTLSLHDALPISCRSLRLRTPAERSWAAGAALRRLRFRLRAAASGDRKSTRLNSSHRTISYAVFCLKKKKIKKKK